MTVPDPRWPPDPLDATQLVRPGGLAAVEHLAETDSTMDRAREIALDPRAVLPAAVVADRQRAGRGRRGAGWWQPPGSLVTSLVLDAAATAASGPQPWWSLACGISVAEAVRDLEPTLSAVVRWPNDVDVAGRKLAGILVEACGAGRVIFGIGVNTTGRAADAPAAIRHRVATLPDLVGRPLPRGRLLAAVVPRLLGLLAGITADRRLLAARYRPLCGLEGRDVAVHVAGGVVAGICRGIADDGSLVVDTESGRVRLASGSLTAPDDVWRAATP